MRNVSLSFPTNLYLAEFLKTNRIVTKEKERRKRKGEEKERRRKKKSNGPVALLVFIIATFEIVFGRKKLFDAKGPLGDNVIKNPARYI